MCAQLKAQAITLPNFKKERKTTTNKPLKVKKKNEPESSEKKDIFVKSESRKKNTPTNSDLKYEIDQC